MLTGHTRKEEDQASYPTVDVARCDLLLREILQQEVDLNGISVETFVDLWSLEEVRNTRIVVCMLGEQRCSRAPISSTNPAERDLARIAPARRGCINSKEVLAGKVR